MTEHTYRVALLSDVHAYSSQHSPHDPAPSSVDTSNVKTIPGQNPFIALQDLIEREGLTADILVNCGDLGDKAQPEAIKYAWDQTREVGTKLGVDTVLGTAGNHDMDSRAVYTNYDARGTLLQLEGFPHPDFHRTNEYWARNVVVIEEPKARIAILNSAAYHGFDNEWQHGRISDTTLEYLRKQIEGSQSDKLNILISHHHVYQITGTDQDDKSAMKSAPALLELLGRDSLNPWIIFHGHRHWPSLSYAQGGNSSPVVFGAGSFAATLWSAVLGRAMNQFYLVDLQFPPRPGRVKGRFRAWDFIKEIGFQKAQPSSGLPHSGGFGGSLSGAELAERIAELVRESNQGYLEWDEVEAHISDVRYALPDDLKQCFILLKENGLRVLEEDGRPSQIGVPRR